MKCDILAEAVLSIMQESIIVLDSLTFKLLLANPCFYKMLRTTRKKTEGRQIYEIVSDLWDKQVLKRALEISLPCENGVHDLEIKYFSPILGERYLLLNGKYLEQPEDEKLILLILEDITGLKRKDEIIHKREIELNMLANNSQNVIVQYDKDRRIIYANPLIETIMGKKVDYYLGKTINELVVAHEKNEIISESLNKVFSTGQQVTSELSYGNPPHLKYYQANFIPQISITGEVVRVIKIMHDITNLKSLNIELKNAQEKMTQVLESISDGFFVLDNAWHFVYLNTSAARLVGFKPEELVGKNIWEEFPVLIEKGYDRYYFAAMQKRVVQEFEMTHPVTETGWFNIKLYPASEGISVYWSDITARKLAEDLLKRDKETLERLVAQRTVAWEVSQEELFRARRLSDLGALSATVAHELRNPLTAIESAVYNIQQKCKGKEAILEKHFQTILKKIDESNQIIDNLLHFAKIKPPHLQEANLYEIIKECELAVLNKYKRPDIKLVNQSEVIKGLVLKLDPTQIKEVFNNILNNAFEALLFSKTVSPESRVEILTSEEKQAVKILIRDNGPGISEENLLKVFEPFFSTKSKGTGLGLAVTKQILENHRGSLGIRSGPNEKTTVIIELPK